MHCLLMFGGFSESCDIFIILYETEPTKLTATSLGVVLLVAKRTSPTVTAT